MSKGSNVLEKTALEQLLGAEGIAELRTGLINIILEEVRNQLRESCDYIVSPEDISSELYDSVIEEIKEEIMNEYKSKIAEAVQKKMENLGI